MNLIMVLMHLYAKMVLRHPVRSHGGSTAPRSLAPQYRVMQPAAGQLI